MHTQYAQGHQIIRIKMFELIQITQERMAGLFVSMFKGP
jgi:hypothetical protein